MLLELNLPIALQKGIWSHHRNPKYVGVLNYVSFVSALNFVSIPKAISKVMNDHNRQAMVEKMDALRSNNTWNIVTLPQEKIQWDADAFIQWKFDKIVIMINSNPVW